MEFGGFWYELFGCSDEELPEFLLGEIQTIVQGNAYIIFAMDGKNGRWFSDSIYYDLPDEEMNCMDEFHDALSKIHSPKGLWRKLIGRTDIYEIFNWTSYEKITRGMFLITSSVFASFVSLCPSICGISISVMIH